MELKEAGWRAWRCCSNTPGGDGAKSTQRNGWHKSFDKDLRVDYIDYRVRGFPRSNASQAPYGGYSIESTTTELDNQLVYILSLFRLPQDVFEGYCIP